MDWITRYQDRVVTAEEAVSHIKDGDRIFMTGNVSVPEKLLNALVARAPELSDIELCHALTVVSSDYVAPEMEGHIRVNSLFVSGNIRQAVQDGRADFTPVLLSEFPLLFKKGVLPLDAAFVHLSPPDEHGFCSLGVEVGLTKSPAESAKVVFAEINEQMPRTLGDAFIHVSRIDYMVPVNYPLAELPMNETGPSDITLKIAENCAQLIPDAATMQTGIGAIPDAVLSCLYDRKDIGIHTELFSDGVIDLVEAGVLTNARKTLHPGKIVAGFILGTKRLYDWVDDNPLCEFHPTEYINDPFVIAQNDNMIAINSAIEVDLTGQICADSIGPKFYSGVGGQLDFIYGASRSKGGVPIIALPSKTKEFSRIVAMLKHGAGVVTTRNHVHYIVTEYGAVNLKYQSIEKRTKKLISIAHPDFRDELEFEAKKIGWL